jgi:hypothetical protein
MEHLAAENGTAVGYSFPDVNAHLSWFLLLLYFWYYAGKIEIPII